MVALFIFFWQPSTVKELNAQVAELASARLDFSAATEEPPELRALSEWTKLTGLLNHVFIDEFQVHTLRGLHDASVQLTTISDFALILPRFRPFYFGDTYLPNGATYCVLPFFIDWR